MNIVITGGSSGIGLACVQRCLAAGHRVITTARKADDIIRLQTLGAEVVELELCDPASIAAAAENIAHACDANIDVLFNNAGYGLQLAMEDVQHAALAEQLQANVIGPVTLTNALLNNMQSGSKLVFNSSVLGIVVMPFRGPYCMSKFAIEAASDAYRLELAGRGINVTVIQPGPIVARFRHSAYAVATRCLHGKQPRLDYSAHLQRLGSASLTNGTLPAEVVADLFLAIAEGRKTKARYLVTRTALIAACLKRVLGSNFFHIAKRLEPLKQLESVKRS